MDGKFLDEHPTVFISRTLLEFNAGNKLLTAKLLNQSYLYHKLRKAFSKFYRRHYDLVSKFNVGFKSLLQQGVSDLNRFCNKAYRNLVYGDLEYKFRNIYVCNDFSTQFRKISFVNVGCNINVVRQTACMVLNPIWVNNFASLFGCTPVGLASVSMTAPA